MKATLDRIEGEMAVLLVRDDESIRLDMPLALLPGGCREGDILDITITRDEKATEDARARISNLQKRLKSKNRANSGLVRDLEY